MLSFANVFLLAALSIVSPKDGTEVTLLPAFAKEYFAQPTKERLRQFDDAAIRKKLLAAGSAQTPICLEWSGADAMVEVSVVKEGEKETVGDILVLSKGVTKTYVTNLEIGQAYRWTVKSGNERVSAVFKTEATPPRLLYVEGVRNIRDMGGWTGLNGCKVRQGLIVRTSALRASSHKKGGSFLAAKYTCGSTNITEAAVQYLQDEFGFKTDIELRSKDETVFMDDTLLNGAAFIKEPFVAYQYIDNFDRGRLPFARMFRKFLDKRNYPILFHCFSGRDRTGSLAFILGGLLGVAKDDLCRDWEASGLSDGTLYFGSSRIESLVGYIDSQSGDTFTEKCESYAHRCGITEEEIARFREIMLEGFAK